MTTTDDPEVFRERWHDHVDDLEGLKQTLHPDDWDELDEAIDSLHDIVDDAADDYSEN
ncbi:hypothetical protein M193_gp078 [Halorubrum tailed phage 7]|uniref:Uncharacterized protein n=1 Tax=Halorubrum sodomense tailed virus 2 TaxID=1262527 RepID=L7TND0_9CAUD|nr:hypothetical protein HSTV2_95 [Halorubrum sodomense tailed virus 2]YP_008060079.1 hypothetical protein M193_gp078 [Halorubrum tailed phage 7]UBF22244.1 hypothetical protein HRTV-2_gp96 [Halorubrum virus HRTV-2]UBF22355.1 hypothetical protein HRTV-11_gp98 [Halorubrum virus HRTV-11]AGC34362.1 hypothetical protein HSTV2_95 [Halorubrum sodomense tailed virus 2]AGM10967.1 hypothetical protein HRTV7_96 [Halorubrum tailed phage 7]